MLTSFQVNRALRAGAAVLVLALAPLAASPFPLPVAASRGALPDRLSDAEFWKLVTDISEPGGFFRITDNYTSNEPEIGRVFTMLRETGVKGGVYLGVGPEQNLTYIAAIRPSMAFVCDIRRQAVVQHLMFKAVFEFSKDRADFISLLFAKPRPANLDASMPIQRLWDTMIAVPRDTDFAAKTYTRIVEHLTKTKGFVLTPDELDQLGAVYRAFVDFGPGITTRGSMAGRGGGGGNNVTFADLTGWSLDNAGQPQSFLSTDENFRTVKALQDKNLIVPVSGDFGGPKAIRAIGAYLRQQGATVSAFYVSNVEQYLFQDGKDTAFYNNVTTLPVTASSVFIRPYALRNNRFGTPQQPLCPIGGFIEKVKASRVGTNEDALACGR